MSAIAPWRAKESRTRAAKLAQAGVNGHGTGGGTVGLLRRPAMRAKLRLSVTFT
jgi:hypothetical protein